MHQRHITLKYRGFIMKLYSLNFKSALCATALLVAGNVAAADQLFMQNMTTKIRIAYQDVETLVKQFISKETPKEFKFTKYVDSCLAEKDKLVREILQPLKDEFANPATQADATYAATVQKTLEMATDIFKKFEEICTILDNHRNSKDWKNCPTLIKPLRPKLEALIAPATLDALTQKLADLESLLIADNAPTVAKEIAVLKALIVKIKNDNGKLKQTMTDTELYNLIRNKLR